MTDTYYFGWWGRVHCPQLWAPDRSTVPLSALTDDVRLRIDGGYCPGSLLIDGKPDIAPPELQLEGKIRHYMETLTGWTILACWDRSVEQRHGAHSTFVLKGLWTIEEAMQIVQQKFPDVWGRLPELLEVVL